MESIICIIISAIDEPSKGISLKMSTVISHHSTDFGLITKNAIELQIERTCKWNLLSFKKNMYMFDNK